MSSDEKVISMDEYRNPKASQEAMAQGAHELRSVRRMGFMALVLGILALGVSGAFFYRTSQNLAVLNSGLSGVNTRMGTMDVRLAELENLPAKTKKMVLDNAIMEMAQRASYLSSQVDNQEQAAKLLQAMDLLQQAR